MRESGRTQTALPLPDRGPSARFAGGGIYATAEPRLVVVVVVGGGWSGNGMNGMVSLDTIKRPIYQSHKKLHTIYHEVRVPSTCASTAA